MSNNCPCPHDADDNDDPGQNFWQKLAAKYEQRVQNLRKERYAVRQRLELLQLQMPIYLCYNLKRSPGKADQYIDQLMRMYMRKNEEVTAPSECMCKSCPVKVPDNFPQNLHNYTYPQKLSTVTSSKKPKRMSISEDTLKENLLCDCQYCVKMVTKRLLKEKEMETTTATYSRFSEKLVPEKDQTCGSNGSRCACPVDLSRTFKDDEICECTECAEEVIRRIESSDIEFEPVRCGCGHHSGNVCPCKPCQSKEAKKQGKKKRTATRTDDVIPQKPKTKDTCTKGLCSCVVDMPKAFKEAAVCDCNVCAEEVIKRIASPDTVFEPLSCGCDGVLPPPVEVDIPICQCNSCKLELARRLAVKEEVEEKQPKIECPCGKGMRPNGDLICDCDICAEKLGGRETIKCECVVGDDTILPICNCSECKKTETLEKTESDDVFCICKCDVCQELREAAEEEVQKIKYSALETAIKCICNCNICSGESKEGQEVSEVPCDGPSRPKLLPKLEESEECLCEEEKAKSPSEVSCTCTEEAAVEIHSEESCTCSEETVTKIEGVKTASDESCTCSTVVSVKSKDEESCTCISEIVATVSGDSCTCSEKSGSIKKTEAPSITESCLCPSQSFSSEKSVEGKGITISRDTSCTCSTKSSKRTTPSVNSCECLTETEIPAESSGEVTDSCACSVSSEKLTQESSSACESKDSCICSDKEMVPVQDESNRGLPESEDIKELVPVKDQSSRGPSEPEGIEEMVLVQDQSSRGPSESEAIEKIVPVQDLSSRGLSESEAIEEMVLVQDHLRRGQSEPEGIEEMVPVQDQSSRGPSESEAIEEIVLVQDQSSRGQFESEGIKEIVPESVSFQSIPEKSDSSSTSYEDTLAQSHSSCSCSEMYDIIEQVDTSCTCSEDFESKSHSATSTYLDRSMGQIRCQSDQEGMKNCNCPVPLKECVCLLGSIPTGFRKSGQEQRKPSFSFGSNRMIVRLAGAIKSSKSILRRRSEPTIKSYQYRKELRVIVHEVEELRQVQPFQLKPTYQLADDFVKKPTVLIETFASLEHCGLLEETVSDISDYSDSISDDLKSADLTLSEVYIAKPIGASTAGSSPLTQDSSSETEETVVAPTERWTLEALPPVERQNLKPHRHRERVYERQFSEEWLKESKSVCSCMVDLETYDSDEPPPDCATEEERCCCVRMKTDKFTKLIVEKYVDTSDKPK